MYCKNTCSGITQKLDTVESKCELKKGLFQMSFEIKSFEPSTSRRKGSSLKYLDTEKYEKTEITQAQYADIFRFNMARDERYGSFCRAVEELGER